MKRILLLFVFIALSISAMWANPVNPSRALTLAQTFWNLQNGHRGGAEFQDVSSAAGVNNFYIFNNINGSGFVLISGDDCAVPVLGYSDANNFETENMPANLRSWLGHYDRTIGNAVADNAVATPEIAQQWANLEAGMLPVAGTRETVSPLLSTQWDQDAPFNNQCPGGSYTGCAATAMAQVMKYHSWPTTGTGSHSYSSYFNGESYPNLSANFGNTTYAWSSMLNSYPYSTSGTTAQRNAVATLMYHCGVAIEMGYSTSGSGAYIADLYYYGAGSHASVEYALKTYFKYKTSIHAEWEEEYTSAQWKNLLKADLRDSLPVVYSGYDENGEGGHAFVCDGFNNSDLFHFNWGWRGYGDGYFAVNDLTPAPGGIGGGNYDFSYSMHAVFGIEPTNGGGGGGGGDDPQASAYDIQMYDNFSVTPSPLQQNATAEIEVTIANYGDADFVNGNLKLVLETSSATLVETLFEGTLNGTIASGSGGRIPFQNLGPITAAPGSYKLALYYKGADESAWSYVGDDLGYANPANITVVGASTPNIQMNSNFSISPNPLRKGQSASITAGITNRGAGAFTGKLKLSLLNASNQEVQMIQQKNVNSAITQYSTDMFTFTGTITVNAGSYKVALYYQPTGASTWTLVGNTYNSNYQNPKSVTVTDPTGIEENGDGVLSIYPNPANDVIRITSASPVMERVEMFDLAGKQVYSALNVASGAEINIADFTSGIYMLRIVTDEGIITRKVVKK